MKNLLFTMAMGVVLLSGCALSGEMNGNTGAGMESPKLSTQAYTSGLPAVQLYFAKGTADYNSSTGSGSMFGYIELENIAYTKQVTVVYQVNAESAWREVSASYCASIGNNRERWYFKTPGFDMNMGINFKFYVKYTVNGTTYYDNNNGKMFNYQVGAGVNGNPDCTLGKSVVVMNKATANQTSGPFNVNGEIILKNLAYNKSVTVVYTTDNWKTVNTLGAYYGHTFSAYDNTEIWYFQTLIQYGVSQIKFAVSYTVNGATYWDNNFGPDYLLTMPGSVR